MKQPRDLIYTRAVYFDFPLGTEWSKLLRTVADWYDENKIEHLDELQLQVTDSGIAATVFFTDMQALDEIIQLTGTVLPVEGVEGAGS